MGIVVIRGAINGENAEAVTVEAIASMIVFAGIGATAGWIADYLVRDSVETMFRRRVDWYRKGLIEQGLIEQDSTDESK